MNSSTVACWPLTLMLVAIGAAAGATPQSNLASGSDGPPPAEPAVVVRDADGHTTVRATRIREAITIDGRLDESWYSAGHAIGDFVQQEPAEGQPATEMTEVWIFFDDRNIYVGARCWDSHPDREVANHVPGDQQGRRRKCRRELPCTARLQRRLLRRPARAADGRRRLRSGHRLPETESVRSPHGVRALQPAPEVDRERAQIHVGRRVRLHHEPARAPRIAPGPGGFPHGISERGSARDRGHVEYSRSRSKLRRA